MDARSRDRVLMRAMKLSLAVGLGMLAIKVYAFAITGSAAIFSDAAESVVHNAAVAFALFSLWYSGRPADRGHPYGHEKIGYFSAGVEGALILIAAGFIIYEAVSRWIAGLELENLGAGTAFTAAAFAINGLLGGYLVWEGRRHDSLILEANGKHVLTDSWTSLGVIIGLLLTTWTGWLPFDPICAIVVALNIVWSGGGLIRRAFRGLMDEADPEIDARLRRALEAACASHGVTFHELRHRKSGRLVWAEVHLLFPDQTPIKKAHAVATEIERSVSDKLGASLELTTHLEPLRDHERIHKRAAFPGADTTNQR